jgi:RNA polymerase sigma-70 factor (ECF subfamily)
VNPIIAIQENNHDAFKEMYLQWHERTYYFFLKKIKSEETAKEMVQLTFIRIWKYRSSLSISHPFEVQLFTTARCVLIDELRKQAHQRELQKSLAKKVYDDSDNGVVSIQFENDNHLKSVLHQLPPVRRKVFELSKLEGYSYKEIATLLAISVKTVDNHLSQAMKQLKALLLVFLITVINLFQ